MPAWAIRATTVGFAALFPVGIYFLITHPWWGQITFGTPTARLIAIQLVWATIAMGLEILALGWDRSSLHSLLRSRSSRADLASFFVVFLGLQKILGTLIGLGLGWHLGKAIGAALGLDLLRMIPSISVQIALAFLASSFVAYWVHYLEHHVPFLWELHKYHHSAEEFSVFTAYRYTALSFNTILASVPIGIIGAPAETLFVLGLWAQFHIFLVHSRLPWHFGAIGRWLYISPSYHRIHHAADPRYYNSNYSVDLVLWDRLFGTYVDPRTKVETIGVPGEPQEGYVKDNIRLTKASYQALLDDINWAWSHAASAIRSLGGFDRRSL